MADDIERVANDAIIEALLSTHRGKRIHDSEHPGFWCAELAFHGVYSTIRTLPLARAAIASMEGDGDNRATMMEREAVYRWLTNTARTAARMFPGDENSAIRRHLVGTLQVNAEAIARGEHRKSPPPTHSGDGE